MGNILSTLGNMLLEPNDKTRASSARISGVVAMLSAIAFAFGHPHEYEMAGILVSAALVALGLRGKVAPDGTNTAPGI